MALKKTTYVYPISMKKTKIGFLGNNFTYLSMHNRGLNEILKCGRLLSMKWMLAKWGDV